MIQDSSKTIKSPFDHQSKEKFRNRDFYLGLALFAFSLTLLFYLIPYHVGTQLTLRGAIKPSFFPNLITIALGLLSILLMFYSDQTSKNITRSEDKQATWITFVFMASLFIYYFAVRLAGMVPASFLAFIFLRWIFGAPKLLLSVVLALIFVISLFFFFEKIANVDIPRGALFDGWY